MTALSGIFPTQSRRKGSRPPGQGASSMPRGLMLSVEKILVFKKINSKYKINKNVKSLAKVDESIIFHYCTVI